MADVGQLKFDDRQAFARAHDNPLGGYATDHNGGTLLFKRNPPSQPLCFMARLRQHDSLQVAADARDARSLVVGPVLGGVECEARDLARPLTTRTW